MPRLTLGLLRATGAIEVYDTFTFDSDEDKKDLDKVLKLFDDYCTPRKNEI